MSNKLRKPIGRLISAVAVLAIALGVVIAGAGSAWAADPAGSITITPPDGAADSQSYSVYKVFDASGNGSSISYKLLSGQTTDQGSAWASSGMSTYFQVDGAGNVSALDAAKENGGSGLSSGAISAIASYVTTAKLSPAKTVTTKNTSGKYVADALADGYYYVTTTTGTVVTIDSVNGQKNVNVNDKNTQPGIDKTIASVEDNAGSVTNDGKNAIAQVGKKVTFNSAITIGRGAKGYVFRDTFPTDDKLSLDASSIKVYKLEANQSASSTTLVVGNLVNAANYTTNTTPQTGDQWTFQITFADSYTKDLTEGQKLVVVYDATVTSNALSFDKATNSATISWGDPTHQTTSEPSSADVYNAKITLNKTFQGLDSSESLPNGQKAEFVLKKTNADGSDSYYNYDNQTTTVSWVASESEATKLEFTKDGTGAFYGLPDGEYTLVEVTWPDGYNKAQDTTIRINGANVEGALGQDNLEKTENIQNRTGSVLPSTGGMGTTAFYIVGGVLIVGAIAYLARRRKANANA